MDFSTRLRQLREEKIISREELAKQMNLSYWAVAKYETGERHPDIETIKKFAKFFAVTIDYILGNTNNPRAVFIDRYADHLSPEDKEFIAKESNAGYITLAKEFSEQDVTPEAIKNLLNLVKSLKKN